MPLLSKINCLFIVVSLTLGTTVFPAIASDFETKAEYAYLLDYNSDTVLLDKNGEEPMGPSSMTKLMTIYLVFDHLKRGEITLDTKFPISEKAWRKGGSKMYVKEGDDARVEDLIRGIIIQSGNDACIVVAEGLAGSEAAFAEDMNFMAKELGMTGSHFKNATGWPDPDHYMTAHDLAILTKRLIDDFPEYYFYFAEKEFTYSKITQPNRNRLLWRNIGADGLKTGHTEDAGYGITASAVQDGRRMIVVVNGLESEKARIAEAERLMRHGFRDFNLVELYKPGATIEHANVWFGNEPKVPLVINQTIAYPINRRISKKSDLALSITYDSPVSAPVVQGDKLGELTITKDGEIDKVVPLYAGKSVDKLSFFGRMKAIPIQYFKGM